MSCIKYRVAVATGLLRPAVLLSLGLVLFVAQPGHAEDSPLRFFKSYNITGDYVVAGTSLWRKGVSGIAREKIEIRKTDLPDDAEVVVALLYVQTAERVQWSGIEHATFRSAGTSHAHDLGPGNHSLAKALTPNGNWAFSPAPCWSVIVVGGRKLVTYRADVLPYFRKDPTTGTVLGSLVKGKHTVEVPDAGPLFGDDDEGGSEFGNILGPRALGASLVVIYRDSNPAAKYKSIVIYDGGFTKRAFSTMVQPIGGFYQASGPDNPRANMTVIVGDGRPILSERVLFNGQLLATDPFKSTGRGEMG